jgi:hypothetical protein
MARGIFKPTKLRFDAVDDGGDDLGMRGHRVLPWPVRDHLQAKLEKSEHVEGVQDARVGVAIDAEPGGGLEGALGAVVGRGFPPECGGAILSKTQDLRSR